MKINKFLIIALMVTMFPLVGQAETNANANVDVESLRAEIQELRIKHKDYKSQVIAEELTREEAIELWKKDLDTFRAKKDQFFINKMGELKGRYEKLAKNFPEKANAIKARWEEKYQQREQRRTEHKKLLQQRRSGEITPGEFKNSLKEQKVDNTKGGGPKGPGKTTTPN